MKKQVKSIKALQSKSAQILEKEDLLKVKGGGTNFTIEDEIIM